MYVPAVSLFSSAATGRPGGLSGCGCAGICGCGGCGGGCGLGQEAEGETSWTDMFSTQVAGFPLWGWLAGAAAALWMMAPGGSEYRAARARLGEKQGQQLARLRSEHRGVKRVGRRIRRGAARIGEAVVPRGWLA